MSVLEAIDSLTDKKLISFASTPFVRCRLNGAGLVL